MVGFVLVSHSRKLAEGAKELGLMMAPGVPVEAAGGLPDGGLGTDYEAISSAIEAVALAGADTVLLIADMGSSCMTAEMVIEDRGDLSPQAILVDCPFAEGAVAAMVSASLGDDADTVIRNAKEAGSTGKF